MNDTIHASPPAEADSRRLQRLFPSVVTPGVEAEGIDLREILSMLRRRIAVIVGCAAVVMTFATVYVYQLTPRYTAQSSLMLEQQKLQLLDIKNVLSGGEAG